MRIPLFQTILLYLTRGRQTDGHPEREREGETADATYFRTRCLSDATALNAAVSNAIVAETMRTYVQRPHVTVLHIKPTSTRYTLY